MQDLFRNQYLKIKLLQKKQGLLLNITDFYDENLLLNKLAKKLDAEQVGFVLLSKNKKFSDREFFNFANKIKMLIKEFDATFIIESRADLASILEADAFAFSNSDLEFSLIKEFLPQDILLGYSTNNSQEIPENIDFLIINEQEKENYKNFHIPTLCILETQIKEDFFSELLVL